MKTCTKCNTPKSDDEFSFRNKAKSIRHHVCQHCHKIAAKTHYHENQKKYYERVKSFKMANRIKMYQYLSDKQCIDCGNPDPLVLDFDHQDGKQKERGIAEMLRKNCWEKILKEIAKCEIRCSNCHRIKTAKELGYTKYLLSQK